MEQQEYEILSNVFRDLKSLLMTFETQRALSEVCQMYRYETKEEIFKVMSNYQRMLDNAKSNLKNVNLLDHMKKFYKWQVDFIFMRINYLTKNLDYIDSVKKGACK